MSPYKANSMFYRCCYMNGWAGYFFGCISGRLPDNAVKNKNFGAIPYYTLGAQIPPPFIFDNF